MLKEIEQRMFKAIDFVKREFNGIRAGKANPTLLDAIYADFYGTPTPLKNMANISAADGRTLVITPYDKGSLKEIEKAVQESDIGIPPNNDGSVIRLIIPPLTEESRKNTAKKVGQASEEARVRIRNERRTALEEAKDADMTEDEYEKFKKDVQVLTDKVIAEVDSMAKAKEQEIMTI